jgi:hypothetical protein
MKQRDVVLYTVLTVVTCGLFGLYWIAKFTNDVHRWSGRPATASGGKAVLYMVLTCTFYFYYWIYKIGGELVDARREHSLPADSVSNTMYTVVTVVMTFVAALFTTLQMLGESFDAMHKGGAEIVAFGLMALLLSFFVQCMISGVIIWFIYRRSDENPRLIYILLAVLRTQLFTIAFLQASFNEALTHQPSEGNSAGSAV